MLGPWISGIAVEWAQPPIYIRALWWVKYHWKGQNPASKWENFPDTTIHTPPQSKSPSSQPFHRGWAIMGRGRGVGREGAKSSTIRL